MTRARAPRTIPTLSAVAAALMIASGTARAAPDAGPTKEGYGIMYFVVPAGMDASAPNSGEPAPIRVFVDGVETTFGENHEIPAGRHTVRFDYREGDRREEIILLKEGETRAFGTVYCPYHPGQALGGVVMPPDDLRGSRSGGCCGSTPEARSAALDLRLTAAVALAAVVSVRRRRKR